MSLLFLNLLRNYNSSLIMVSLILKSLLILVMNLKLWLILRLILKLNGSILAFLRVKNLSKSLSQRTILNIETIFIFIRGIIGAPETVRGLFFFVVIHIIIPMVV